MDYLEAGKIVYRVISEVGGTIATNGIQELDKEQRGGMSSFLYVRSCLVATAYNSLRALPGFSFSYAAFCEMVEHETAQALGRPAETAGKPQEEAIPETVKVYALATDGNDNGTEVAIFTSEADLWRSLAQSMVGDESEDAHIAAALIDSEDFETLSDFLSERCPTYFTYCIDSKEIPFPHTNPPSNHAPRLHDSNSTTKPTRQPLPQPATTSTAEGAGR